MASVLLAEPSVPVAGALRRYLEGAGHEVSQAGSAQEALRAAQVRPPSVLLASGTGTLDGEALCRELRRQGLSVPVLLLYPPTEEMADERATEAGADGCLVGPLKRANVLTCVALLLQREEAESRLVGMAAEAVSGAVRPARGTHGASAQVPPPFVAPPEDGHDTGTGGGLSDATPRPGSGLTPGAYSAAADVGGSATPRPGAGLTPGAFAGGTPRPGRGLTPGTFGVATEPGESPAGTPRPGTGLTPGASGMAAGQGGVQGGTPRPGTGLTPGAFGVAAESGGVPGGTPRPGAGLTPGAFTTGTEPGGTPRPGAGLTPGEFRAASAPGEAPVTPPRQGPVSGRFPAVSAPGEAPVTPPRQGPASGRFPAIPGSSGAGAHGASFVGADGVPGASRGTGSVSVTQRASGFAITPVPGSLTVLEPGEIRRASRTDLPAVGAGTSPDFEFLKRLMLMEVKRSRRYRYPIALLLVELDLFPARSATLPPAARTAVLAEALGALVGGVRDIDVAVPFADSRFVVFLPHTPRSGALVVAERLRERVGALRGLPGTTASVGMAVSEPPSGKGPASGAAAQVSFGSLLKEAGEALRRAQASGGNRVEPAGGKPQPG
jgi:diguanylate cyclase (GGDEF)-like protein